MDYVLDETRLGLLIDEATARLTWLSETGLLIATAVAGLGLLVLSVIAWAKGRKVAAILTWLVLLVLALLAILPASATDEMAIDWVPLGLGLALAGVVLFGFGFFIAFRLAKPSSWWAQRRYDSERYDRSVERHGWSRIRAR